MPIVRAQCEIPMTWQDQRDAVVNTFHFSVNVVDSSTLSSLTTALVGAYNNLETWFSAHVAVGPTGSVTYYNLDQPIPRPPLQTDSLGITRTHTTGTTALPHEVAAVLTYQALPTAGVNQQRRRGRVYFGPLDEAATTEGHFEDAFMSSVAAFGVNLLQSSNGNPNWVWVVWSKTGNTNSIVNDGWVDEAADTQRRRGVDPITRINWTSAGADPTPVPQIAMRRFFLFS